MKLSRLPVILLLPASLLGCPKKNVGGSDAAPEGRGGPVAAEAGVAPTSSGDVESVYPVDPKAPIDPLAEKLCNGLTQMPEKKRAACCSTQPGIVMASECTRMLSASIQGKAVELAPAAVDACIAAFEKTLDGCDWVGPFPPGPPRECQDILKGVLGEGAQCRSSLECAGSLRCRGVGPTTPGKCSVARDVGEVCGGTTDSLATFVRQNDVDKQHPECATGHCINHRCAAPAGLDQVCHVTLDCADGLQCLPAKGPVKKGAKPERKCAHAPVPTKGGDACPGGVCAGELQCVSNKCTRRKAGGEECTNDFECRGGCVKEGAASKGKCGPRCDIR